MIRSQRPGVNRCRILAAAIWLSRCIRHAELVKSDSLDAALAQFVADRLDALAGLKPRLLNDVEQLPGARILDGQFSAVQQAIGTTALARARAAIEEADAIRRRRPSQPAAFRARPRHELA